MKKFALIMALLLVLLIPVSAAASVARTPQSFPSLSFNGTTANCSLTILTNDSSASINATVQLWQGNTCLQTWYASGTGRLTFSGTQSVTSGLQYTLTVSATVNGSSLSVPTVTKTCP